RLASLARMTSRPPGAAYTPVRGSTIPILILCAARTGTTKGEAICNAPIAAAPFKSARRSDTRETIGFFMAVLPGLVRLLWVGQLGCFEPTKVDNGFAPAQFRS